MKPKPLPGFLVRLALQSFEGLGSPVAIGAAAMLRNGDWKGLAELSVDPRRYLTASAYFADHAATTLFKKLKDLPNDVDRASVAKQKWWQGERQCYKTNERLSPYLIEHSPSADVEETVSAFVADVRKIIRSWIGLSPPLLLEGRFGPGATFSDRGKLVTVPDKMSSNPSLTADAISFAFQWCETQWATSVVERQGELSFVRGNRFTTVPKTCLTDRSIASEPSINMFYQLGLGRAIRQRLKNAGWDLDRAQTIHKRVARESSRSRRFATLDLSNASDTVCSNIVKLLLPRRWYDQLNDLRSKFTYLDGRWVRLEKFSSMGNGFTFELETLIFAALCAAVLKQHGYAGQLGEDLFVFGDDIIVPTEMSTEVISVLRFFGFSLNEEKSFYSDEPFRESCGGDYFNGHDVRGVYLKKIPEKPMEFISFANQLRALYNRAHALGEDLGLKAWLTCVNQLDPAFRACRGPEALGDIVIHDDFEYWSLKVRHGIRYVRALIPDRVAVRSYHLYPGPVVLACATYGTGGSPGGVSSDGRPRRAGVIPRDGVISHKVGWVPYS